MRVGALDLGSNTFLLLIAEVEAGQIKEVICDHTQVVRLGQGVGQTRQFHPEALQRVEQCFAEYRRLMDLHQVEKVRAVATSAARDAQNKESFFALGERFGIPIRVIEGALEADLTFQGATMGMPSGPKRVVVDVGGGSTEIIGQSGVHSSIKGYSLDIGSVRMTEKWISGHPVSLEELRSLRESIDQELKAHQQHLPQGQIDQVVAVAGTPTTLACLKMKRDFAEEFVHGLELSVQELEEWLSELAKMSVEERENLPGMPPKRSDVLVAGLAILIGAVQNLGKDSLTVSTRGVRYGLACAEEWV